MTILCFDTETIEHPQLPTKACEDGKERVPAAVHLQLVAACGVVLEERGDHRAGEDLWYEATRTCTFGGVNATPREILLGLAKAFKVRPLLVGYNSGGFDLHVLVAEAMELGIPVPLLFDREVSYRYSKKGHEDLQDSLTNYGAGKAGSQDAWARRIGLPGKMGVDGSQVKELHAAGRHQEISDYCLCDSGQLSGIWIRKELISGGLSLDGYRRSAGSLVGLFEKERALRAIVEHERFDMVRFLLEDAQ